MSTLSNTLVNKFVSATNDSSSTSTTTTTAYGTVTISGSTVYVTVDGSETATPVSSSSTTVRQGDRVVVTIKNHTATITTNLTTTAALVSTEDVENTSDLAIRVAALEASMITSDYLAKYYASIESLTNSSADLDVNTLTSKEITAETLTALGIDVTTVTGDSGTFKYLTADSAEFKTLSSNVATIQEAYIDEEAVNKLLADYVKAETAAVTYLTVDMANVKSESVEQSTILTLFTTLGLITTEVVNESNICTLNAVEINANDITAGTLTVDHLQIVGENSIVYEINANSEGLTSTELTDETAYQNLITGNAIIANSITATQIAAGTITSVEIAANTITASNLNITTLSAICANIGELTINGYLTTNSKRTIYNAAVEGMTIDANGIGAWGDADNYWTLTNTGKFEAHGSVSIYGRGSVASVVDDVSCYPSLSIDDGSLTLSADGYTVSTSPIGAVHIYPDSISMYYQSSSSWLSASSTNKWLTVKGEIYGNSLSISESALVEGDATIDGSIAYGSNGFTVLEMDAGTVSGNTCNAGEITDLTVKFNHTFSSVPCVLVGLYSNTTSSNYGSITPFVYNITTTGFTLRVANANSTSYTPGFRWIALGS